ncbi:MAG: alpha/beta hydrolase [Clostridiales bacterium]|nr:alpha/beta hydrolase [Clostridiales bacterium]
MRKYSQKDIDELSNCRETTEVNGTEVFLKRLPECQRGHRDPYEKACVNPEEQIPDMEIKSAEDEIRMMRQVAGFPSQNLNMCQIYTYYEEMEAENVKFGVWRYEKRWHTKAPRSCLVYIHGGGWVAGSVYAAEQQCRFIAEKADAVVFNIDYSLAPEQTYPIPVLQIYTWIQHIHENPEKYGIDPEKIMVAGDSAGGHMTASVALRDRDCGNHYIAEQYLCYPVLYMGLKRNEGYVWSRDLFESEAEDQAEIEMMLRFFRDDEPHREISALQKAFMPDSSIADQPYLSPALADTHEGLPKTVIATAEYDSLRIQGEFYGGILKKANVPVKVVRYCGCQHAILDRMGYIPQAEELCLDIAEELKNL